VSLTIPHVKQLLRPLARRVRMLATKVIVAQVDDSQPLQLLQLTGLGDERIPNAQRIQQFGSRGNPPAGSIGIRICLGGAGSFPVVVSVEHPGSVPDGALPDGGYEIYDSSGTYLRFNADGTWYLKAATSGTVDCPDVQFTGNANVRGNLVVQGTALFDQTVTVLGALEAEGTDGSGNSITTTGNIAGGASISDAHGSMQAMRVVYNGHTQAISGGVAQAPSSTM
jgi:phage baseplate assembly protein V